MLRRETEEGMFKESQNYNLSLETSHKHRKKKKKKQVHDFNLISLRGALEA